MGLKDLERDERTSIDANVVKLVNIRRFTAILHHLEAFKFWNPPDRRKPLWEHQRAAVETVTAYLAADPHLPHRLTLREAALLKLPTGTGKSGVVAVLARCLPDVKRTLVLTPRKSLVAQMKDDVRFRFWKHLQYPVKDGETFVADAAMFGNAMDTAYVETLLPSKVGQILQHVPAADKAVLVGTYQALDAIRRRTKDPRPNRAAARKAAEELLDLLRQFDLILVDEGHYEPAISWSKGVRELNRPTVLLSATPYRNDFKSFRVSGRFVFNYPHHDAVRAHVIRDVEVVAAKAPQGGSATERFVSALAGTLPTLKKKASAWTATPKIMVRADDLETLYDLQKLIDEEFGTQSVVVHDRATGSKRFPRRFNDVRRAFRDAPDAEFWLHQFKLMEGVDDPDFIVAAIFDPPSNGRQLVQQIGRIVRNSPGRHRVQTAWVVATDKNAAKIEGTWERYKEYEKYCAKETDHIVANEIALPDRVLELMPQNQYIGGEFRKRFDSSGALSADDLQLLTSAAVFEWERSQRAIEELKEAFEDAIMEEDRFRVVPIEGLPPGCVGYSYYAWRNSPLLIDKFFSEWKLGVFIAVQEGDLMLVQDTEGVVLDPSALGLKPASRNLMQRAFPEDSRRQPSKLTRMAFASLDMSDKAIRTMSMRTRSFETTFTDLLDPHLVPTAAAGFVAGRGRYVGFATARFRDSNDRLPLYEYIDWTRAVARKLRTTADGSPVFGRYALIRDNITEHEAQPVTILLNLSRDDLLEDTPTGSEARRLADDPDIDHDDLCADVDADGNFSIKVLGKRMDCTVSYNPNSELYRFLSDDLNELFRARQRKDRAQAPTASQRIATQQSFRIMVTAPGVVYAEKKFFEPRITLRQPDGSIPILDDVHTVPILGNVKSEKGEAFFANRARWRRESVFGVVEAICRERNAKHRRSNWKALGEALGRYPLVICDDDSKEIADFIAVDPANRRVAFLHGKALKDGVGQYHVDTLQEVGRQAAASLAFLTRTPPPQGWEPRRWGQNVQANRRTLNGRSRTFKNANGLTPQQITDTLRTACGNASYTREVWIVAGNMLDREIVRNAIARNNLNNRLWQFLIHWEGLRTACGRAGAHLSLFCH
ncbi:MAG: DEAD/DEAH box helicase family protein [Pseudorhodoplanes sp.]|jgi:superfamily II DNA or RNA helicase|nr:DEAD/DEAH box helicase family protein [Pseudorhodoplanes sp.]